MALRNTTVPLEIVQQLEAERIQRRAQRQAMAQQIEMQRLQQMAEPVRWAQPEPERVNAAADPFNRKASAEAGLQNMRDGSAMQRQRESQAHDSAMMDKKGALEKDLLRFRMSIRPKSGSGYGKLLDKLADVRTTQAQHPVGAREHQAFDAEAQAILARLPAQHRKVAEDAGLGGSFAQRMMEGDQPRQGKMEAMFAASLAERQAGLTPPQEGMTPATAVQAMKLVGDPVAGMGLGADRDTLRRQAMGVIQGQQAPVSGGGDEVVERRVVNGRTLGMTRSGNIIEIK